ncbi:DUF600 family protein [Terrilactibacillus sp. S3-3]|nr:DUF600 family protein [Terrilactibacillus sp. S3-3]
METKQMEVIYQKVANVLIDIIPEDWKKILLYAEVRKGFSQVYYYYYSIKNDKPIYSLDITELFSVNENEFDELETELYDCFKKLWNEFKVQEQEQWTYLTFILNNTGQMMKINYGYEDVSQLGPVEKQEKWEAKYLS